MRKRVCTGSGKSIGLHPADVNRIPIIGQAPHIEELGPPSNLGGSVGSRRGGYDCSTSGCAGTAGA